MVPHNTGAVNTTEWDFVRKISGPEQFSNPLLFLIRGGLCTKLLRVSSRRPIKVLTRRVVTEIRIIPLGFTLLRPHCRVLAQLYAAPPSPTDDWLPGASQRHPSVTSPPIGTELQQRGRALLCEHQQQVEVWCETPVRNYAAVTHADAHKTTAVTVLELI